MSLILIHNKKGLPRETSLEKVHAHHIYLLTYSYRERRQGERECVCVYVCDRERRKERGKKRGQQPAEHKTERQNDRPASSHLDASWGRNSLIATLYPTTATPAPKHPRLGTLVHHLIISGSPLDTKYCPVASGLSVLSAAPRPCPLDRHSSCAVQTRAVPSTRMNIYPPLNSLNHPSPRNPPVLARIIFPGSATCLARARLCSSLSPPFT